MQEAHIEKTPVGQVPADGGWFILNLGELAWETVPGFGVWCDFDGPEHDSDTPGIGVHVHVLQPGEAPGYYHAEEAQEGFIVLSGECIAIVEGQERRDRGEIWGKRREDDGPGYGGIWGSAGVGACTPAETLRELGKPPNAMTEACEFIEARAVGTWM